MKAILALVAVLLVVGCGKAIKTIKRGGAAGDLSSLKTAGFLSRDGEGNVGLGSNFEEEFESIEGGERFLDPTFKDTKALFMALGNAADKGGELGRAAEFAFKQIHTKIINDLTDASTDATMPPDLRKSAKEAVDAMAEMKSEYGLNPWNIYRPEKLKKVEGPREAKRKAIAEETKKLDAELKKVMEEGGGGGGGKPSTKR